jgi:hypothetical protein
VPARDAAKEVPCGTGWRGVALLLLVTAGCGHGRPGTAAQASPAPGPAVLLDESALAGWAHAGPGDFQLVDGVLRSRGGMGLLWYRAPFRNFVLDLDWRVTASTDNSGVFVRFPAPGDDPWVAVNAGYEIQINDNPAGDPQKTGAIYGFQPASVRASRPVGQWNHYSIRVVGHDYTVWLNQVLVNRFAGTDRRRATVGHIGLQNHDAASQVQFRDIRVRELP